MKFLKSTLLFTIASCFLLSCQKQDLTVPSSTAAQAPATALKKSHLASDVANDWMEVLRTVVKMEGKTPPQASRIYAYAAIAMYEAVIPGFDKYQSLQGQVAGLPKMPKLTNKGKADFTVAGNEAIYQVALKIFGTLKDASRAKFDAIHDEYKDTSIAKEDDLLNSITFGSDVAKAVLYRADNDGFTTTRLLAYLVPSSTINPAFWLPTSAALTPLEPYWGTLKCFAMADGAACNIKSAIPFNTTINSPFFNQAVEVASTGSNLTESQKDIALWWADGTGVTSTPPGHWVNIGAEIATQLDLDLGKTAEMFALLNMTMADAFISCWNQKYQYNLLRPITYIRKYIPGQSSWSSFIPTPPFPEYPSGHSVASAAAANILTRLFGDLTFTDQSSTTAVLTPRTYISFTEAAKEAALSRLYGGIHFREAIENGLKQGVEVGNAVAKNIKLKK